MSGRLAGKVAVVTGGASGIGRRTAELFAAEGARVVLGDVDAAMLAETTAAIGGDCIAVEADVRKEADIERLVAAAVESFGRLDLAVNSAGLGTFAPIHQHELSEWQRVIDITLTGVFLSVKHEARQMLSQNGGGAIVNIASINARQPAEGMVAYCTAKAGVEMLTKVAALEMGSSGVRVNAIAPGFVDTPMTALIQGPARDAFIHDIPMGRPGSPDDVAQAALFLVSNDASWVNGETLVVDGGEVHREFPRLMSGSLY